MITDREAMLYKLEFDTQEAAEVTMGAHIDTYGLPVDCVVIDKFCPVIKDRCQRDCICFNQGELYVPYTQSRHTKQRILTQNAYCSHVMIAGAIDANT